MADRGPYKALTRIHLPVIEKDYAPGDPVPLEDLEAAEQSEDQISDLITNGSLGEEDDELHFSSIIPRPDMPTIEKAVMDAKEIKAEYERRGEEVPAEVEAMATLDYSHAVTGDEGKSGDANV